EVVVAVHTDHRFVDILYLLLQMADEIEEFLGIGIAHGVRDIDGVGTGGDGHGIDIRQEVPVGPSSIFRRELYAVCERLAEGYRVPDGCEHLVPVHTQLVLHVYVGGGDEGVQARHLRIPYGFPGGLDVFIPGTAQADDDRPAYFFRYCLNGIEIPWRRYGKARFDLVHAKDFELLGHQHLFMDIHAGAGRLLTVAQCRVKYDYLVLSSRHVTLPSPL